MHSTNFMWAIDAEIEWAWSICSFPFQQEVEVLIVRTCTRFKHLRSLKYLWPYLLARVHDQEYATPYKAALPSDSMKYIIQCHCTSLISDHS